MNALTARMSSADRFPGTRNWRFTGRRQQFGSRVGRIGVQVQYQQTVPNHEGLFPWHSSWIPLDQLDVDSLIELVTIGEC